MFGCRLPPRGRAFAGSLWVGSASLGDLWSPVWAAWCHPATSMLLECVVSTEAFTLGHSLCPLCRAHLPALSPPAFGRGGTDDDAVPCQMPPPRRTSGYLSNNPWPLRRSHGQTTGMSSPDTSTRPHVPTRREVGEPLLPRRTTGKDAPRARRPPHLWGPARKRAAERLWHNVGRRSIVLLFHPHSWAVLYTNS